MVFLAVMFSVSVGTMRKIYRVCKKYNLRNVCTCHPRISSDRQGGELVGAKLDIFEILIWGKIQITTLPGTINWNVPQGMFSHMVSFL